MNDKFNLIVPAVIAILSIVIFFLVHPAQRYSFVPAMLVAFVCYLRTSYRELTNVERVLPVYLVALQYSFCISLKSMFTVFTNASLRSRAFLFLRPILLSPST